MAKYTRQAETALRLIKKAGTTCSFQALRSSATSDDKAWKPKRSLTQIDSLYCVVFDDDGETFLNHNISGRTRIVLIAPDVRLKNIDVGDKVLITGEVLNVEKIKQLNPDNEGAILWTLLVR